MGYNPNEIHRKKKTSSVKRRTSERGAQYDAPLWRTIQRHASHVVRQTSSVKRSAGRLSAAHSTTRRVAYTI